jgi:hypothetical protein
MWIITMINKISLQQLIVLSVCVSVSYFGIILQILNPYLFYVV